MSTTGWKRRLLGPPRGQRLEQWPIFVSMFIGGMVATWFAMELAEYDVPEWFAFLASAGWLLALGAAGARWVAARGAADS